MKRKVEKRTSKSAPAQAVAEREMGVSRRESPGGLVDRVTQSPRMLRQKATIQALFGPAAQAPVQRMKFHHNGKELDTDKLSSKELAELLPLTADEQAEERAKEKKAGKEKEAFGISSDELESLLSGKPKLPRVELTRDDAHVVSQSLKGRIIDTMKTLPGSSPTPEMQELLDRHGIDMLEFTLQRSDKSNQALTEYIKSRGEKGMADASMLRSLYAHSEIHRRGLDKSMLEVDARVIGDKALPDNENWDGLSAVSVLADREKDSILKAYGITQQEHLAIQHYTNAHTNALMERDFGSASAGWRFLQSAMEKLPSTGDLGLIHSSFRLARKDEGPKIMSMPKNASLYHGLSVMEHGQRHYLSTATGYNVHTTSGRAGKAGGIMEIQGTSGRYINPFGIQASSTDGAEVLYPPGTMTRYTESVNTDPQQLAMHRFTEVDAPHFDASHFWEDGNYLPVDLAPQRGELLNGPARLPIAATELRRRKVFKTEEHK